MPRQITETANIRDVISRCLLPPNRERSPAAAQQFKPEVDVQCLSFEDNYCRDRGHLEVSAMLGSVVSQGVQLDSENLPICLHLTVTNAGRRPVFFKGFGGGLSKSLNPELCRNFILITRTQPQPISEGHFVTETFPLTQELKDNLLRAYSLYAYDTLNRHYNLKGFEKFKQSLKSSSVCPDGTTLEDVLMASEGLR